MRRILFFMLAFVAASVSVSCVDEVSDPSVFMQELTFSASCQSETKTALVEGNEVYWLPGDQIAVSGASDPFVTDIAAPSGFTQFTGAASPASEYYAVYPYASLKSWDGSTATVEIPQIQTAVKGTFADDLNISVASTSSEDMLFRFHNVLGYVKFTVSDQSGTIKSVTVSAIGNEPLAGDVQVDCSSDSPSASSVENSESYVTLTSEAVLEPDNYYIAMLPGTYASGLEFTFMNDKGQVATKQIARELTLSAGQIRNIGEMKGLEFEEVTIDPTQIPDNEIWYVMSDGTTYDVYLTTKQYGHQPFDAKVISNTYKNGYGIIKFDAPVTKINDHTFGNSWAANMTELYLPDCIEYLGTGAIYHTGLTTLYIPKNLKFVDSYGLNNPNLESFTGSHITEDGRCVIIEDGFMPNYGNIQTPVKNYMAAFAPAGITEYTLPNNVEILGWYTFAWCPELRKITFNEGLKTIMGDCFMYTQLDCDIIFPSTLETLDSYAFHSCSGIKGFYGNEKFHTSDHLCLIFEQTTCWDPEKNGKWINRFVGYDVTDYSIPEGIKGIENYSFDHMPNLKTVTLPSSIVEVGAYAFNHCDNLEALYGECVSDDHKAIIFDTHFRKLVITKDVVNYSIPDDITSVGYCAFTESPEIETITMGDQITHIEGYAFSDCPNLKTITLSAGLKDISGSNAFLNSEKLESIYCRALVPPLYYDDQMSEFPNLKFYVPEQSLSLYQNHASWSPFKKYFVGYKYDDLGDNDYYISSDYSADGAVTTLQTATVGNGIDIVLMGDAYSDREIADGSYEADMEYMYDNLFTQEPFKTHKDMFNVYYVNVVSATEGYEYSGAALGGYFGSGTLVGGNDNAVFEYALNAITEDEMDEALIIVAMNSDAYAGTCYMYYPESATGTYGSGPAVAYFPKGSDQTTFAQLLHHEANGHGFAKLADEYAYEDYGAVPEANVTQTRDQQNSWGWWKNVDFTNDPVQVRWSYFLEDSRYANEGLGVFEGGLTYWSGVWRPTEDSIMRYNTGGFNAPSREAIYYRIHKLAYGDSWEYDYEDFVEYDAVNRSASSSAPQKTRRNYVERPLEPTAGPVVVGKSWRDAR